MNFGEERREARFKTLNLEFEVFTEPFSNQLKSDRQSFDRIHEDIKPTAYCSAKPWRCAIKNRTWSCSNRTGAERGKKRRLLFP